MKKILFAVLAIGISTISFSQINKGTRFYGVGINFGQQRVESQPNVRTNTSFTVSPSYSKAIKENVVHGINLSFGYSSNHGSFIETTRNYSIGANVFRRRYTELAKAFLAFGECSLGASYAWNNNNLDIYGLNAGLGAGIAYNASNKYLFFVGIPNVLGFNASYNRQKSGTSTNKIYNVGFNSTASFNNLQFGVRLMRL